MPTDLRRDRAVPFPPRAELVESAAALARALERWLAEVGPEAAAPPSLNGALPLDPASSQPAAEPRDLLEIAAAESRARLRHDRERVAQRLEPLLAYLEGHLFDRGLNVTELKKACGVRDNTVPIQFHSALGRPPHGYLEDRRLETAARLLADTGLRIWQIAELVGYLSIQVHSRAFLRWSGLRPSAYRRLHAPGGPQRKRRAKTQIRP